MRNSPKRTVRCGARWGRWVRAVTVGVVLVAGICPAPAYAQQKDEKNGPPYDVAGLESKTQILPWIFGFSFIALCVLVGMKNPQRAHS